MPHVGRGEASARSFLANDPNLEARGDVVARLREALVGVRAEDLRQAPRGLGLGEATAHLADGSRAPAGTTGASRFTRVRLSLVCERPRSPRLATFEPTPESRSRR